MIPLLMDNIRRLVPEVMVSEYVCLRHLHLDNIRWLVPQVMVSEHVCLRHLHLLSFCFLIYLGSNGVNIVVEGAAPGFGATGVYAGRPMSSSSECCWTTKALAVLSCMIK